MKQLNTYFISALLLSSFALTSTNTSAQEAAPGAIGHPYAKHAAVMRIGVADA